MKTKPFLFFSALMASLLSCNVMDAQIHVSQDGNDKALGSSTQPLKTLDEALRRARKFKEAKTVYLGEGTWVVPEGMSLGVEDSNTSIVGKGMGKSIISGGVELPPFSLAEDWKDMVVWKVDLSKALPCETEFQQLYVNGERAILARTPNASGSKVMRKEGNKDKDNEKDGLATNNCYLTLPVTEVVKDGVGSFTMGLDPVVGNALEKVSRKPSDVRLTLYHKWNQTVRNVSSISDDGSTLYFKGKPQVPWNHVDESSQFILENDISFLDQAGEWFFDKATRILYYIPRPGQEIQTTKAVVPLAKQLLTINGDVDNRVTSIKIKGVSFLHTSFLIGPEGQDPMQAGGTTNAAVELNFIDGFSMEDCEIAHTGNNGIWLKEACRDCDVVRCRIHDLGIGGVKIGTTTKPSDEDLLLTKRIKLDNCIVQGGSRVLATGTGVLLFNASDCAITHNEISDFGYTGISVGWNWGYAHSPSKRNDISYNHIHHLGWGLLSDMGGIYTLGPSEGTKVTHNVIHHIYSLGYGGWGLYPDEGSTDIVWEYNLVHDCKSAGFHMHYGKNNIVRNNLFVNQINEQLAATRIEEHTSFIFESNVIAFSEGNMYSHNWNIVNSIVRNNLYWKFGGDVQFNGTSMDDWKSQTGKDEGSIIADPRFRNLAKDDFKMSSKKALKTIGFTQFDWTEAGVYGSAQWKRLAKLDESRTKAYSETIRQLRGL